MRINLIGTAFIVEDPGASARWFAEHLGFSIRIDIGWYVNTQNDDQPAFSLDFVQRDHESVAEVLRAPRVAGTLVGFLVDDVDAEETRLRAAGVEVVHPLTTEPWGQRRFRVQAPEGVVVEVLQMVEPDPRWLAEHGVE